MIVYGILILNQSTLCWKIMTSNSPALSAVPSVVRLLNKESWGKVSQHVETRPLYTILSLNVQSLT